LARRLRSEPTTVPLHVTARGVRRLALFRDDDDFDSYLHLLAGAKAKFDWRILSFCLLPNHVHLIFRLDEPNLGAGMKWLHCLYAKRFNRRYGFTGHAFDSRYASRPIESDDHFFRAVRYVALNPVTAGLCRDPSDWPWSSFAGTAGEGREFSFVQSEGVRSMYAPGQGDGARAYADAVRSKLGDELLVWA
jgi:putative transposase